MVRDGGLANRHDAVDVDQVPSRGAGQRVVRAGPSSWRMTGTRFQVGGEALCLAILAEGELAQSALEDLVARIRAILREGLTATQRLRRAG